MDKLRSAYKEVLILAKTQAGRISRRALRGSERASQPRTANLTFVRNHSSIAFAARLQKLVQVHTLAVDLQVPHTAPLGDGVDKDIEILGRGELDRTKQFFEEAISELQGLSTILLQAFGAAVESSVVTLQAQRKPTSYIVEQLRSSEAASFTATGRAHETNEFVPGEANVRMIASAVPFPTSSTMAQLMVSRAAIEERLVAQKSLGLELQLFKAESRILQRALDKNRGHIDEAA